MGDYNNQLSFNSNGGSGLESFEISDEYHTNGRYAAKITFNGAASGYVRYRIPTVSEFINKTILFKANIKTAKQIEFAVYYKLNGTYTQTKVDVPEDSEGLFEVSLTAPEGITELLFGIDCRVDTGVVCYTDNWMLFVE